MRRLPTRGIGTTAARCGGRARPRSAAASTSMETPGPPMGTWQNERERCEMGSIFLRRPGHQPPFGQLDGRLRQQAGPVGWFTPRRGSTSHIWVSPTSRTRRNRTPPWSATATRPMTSCASFALSSGPRCQLLRSHRATQGLGSSSGCASETLEGAASGQRDPGTYPEKWVDLITSHGYEQPPTTPFATTLTVWQTEWAAQSRGFDHPFNGTGDQGEGSSGPMPSPGRLWLRTYPSFRTGLARRPQRLLGS